MNLLLCLNQRSIMLSCVVNKMCALRSLSTSNLLPQHVAIADMLLSDTTISPTTTCCPRRHVALADMLPSDTSMSPTTACCLNMSPKIQFCRILHHHPTCVARPLPQCLSTDTAIMKKGEQHVAKDSTV